MKGRVWLSYASSLALALILAVIMWFVSSESITPLEEQRGYPTDAPLALTWRNVPPGFVVYEPSVRDVRVDLRGLRTGLAAIRPGDVRPYVDLSGVTAEADTVTVPIRIDCDRCARRGVRVVGQDALTATLGLAPEATQTRSVTVVFDEALPGRYRIAGSPVTPGQVRLRGAEQQLAKVGRVTARIGALPESTVASRPVDEAVLRDVAVVPVGLDDMAVPDVDVVPEVVTVTLQLRSRGTDVSVRPDIVGTEADGYYITGISVDPPIVQLEGPPQALADIGEEGAAYARLDIDGATDDVVRRVPLDVPEGVTALNAPDGVTVTVRVSALAGTVTLEVPVDVRGLAPGLVVRSISPRKVDVLVGGPRAELSSIGAADVDVFVDLAGMGAGRHSVSPRPSVPSGFLWRSVSPAIVDVVIEALGRGTPGAR